MRLDVNKASGPDGVHPKLLKECAAPLAYPLFLVFARSLESSNLPTDWKHALVAPMYKACARFNPLNYRPLSLTSVCGKVFERIIVDHSHKYMEEHQLISNRQFGFRAGRGTEDQLLLMYGRVAKCVDGGGVVDVLYLDFSKAFDLVCHRVLLEKLLQLGFDRTLVCWIENFLVARTFSVKVDGFLRVL